MTLDEAKARIRGLEEALSRRTESALMRERDRLTLQCRFLEGFVKQGCGEQDAKRIAQLCADEAYKEYPDLEDAR